MRFRLSVILVSLLALGFPNSLRAAEPDAFDTLYNALHDELAALPANTGQPPALKALIISAETTGLSLDEQQAARLYSSLKKNAKELGTDKEIGRQVYRILLKTGGSVVPPARAESVGTSEQNDSLVPIGSQRPKKSKAAGPEFPTSSAALKSTLAELVVPNTNTPAPTSKLEQDVSELQKKYNLLSNPETFKGFNFGIGLSLTMDIGEHDRVKSAEIINNRVVVNEDRNVIPRFLLESHYFFTPCGSFLGKTNRCRKCGKDDKELTEWGVGPFVAVQPGDDIIDAVGAGLMVGFRRKPDQEGVSKLGSFNLGIGVIVDPSTQILADGFSPNQPPPAGETQVRFKKTNQIGVVVVFSVAF